MGMYKRMGDEVHQDQAVTLAVMHRLIDGLEKDYKASRVEEERDGFVDQAIFVMAAFLVALKGE